VEDSASGKGGVKYPDWRAAAHLLSISDPKRFSDASARVQIDMNTPPPAVPLDLLEKALTTALARQQNAAAIDVATVDAKQIPDAKPA
jgi:hypothetical protein